MTYVNQKNFRTFENPDIHPCLKEAQLSLKCLEENNYVNHKCVFYFDNYNKCKEFWGMIKAKRTELGIRPKMPTEKERKLILAKKEEGEIIYSVKVDDD